VQVVGNDVESIEGSIVVDANRRLAMVDCAEHVEPVIYWEVEGVNPECEAPWVIGLEATDHLRAAVVEMLSMVCRMDWRMACGIGLGSTGRCGESTRLVVCVAWRIGLGLLGEPNSRC